MRAGDAIWSGLGYRARRPRRTVATRRRGLRAFALVFVVAGLVGVYRYVHNFWLYRGYPPPYEPRYLARGASDRFALRSFALGGRRVPVLVYLPPGYRQSPRLRYPVLYLLHGAPGRPDAFLRIVRLGVLEDLLVARGQMQPLLLVMPRGSSGLFGGNDWVDGRRRNQRWETFVARDLVHAIDARYRTIARGAARGIGGLSAGGYGATNIALHHPGEFGLVESWSGYMVADYPRARADRRRRDSPLLELPASAAALRRAQTFFWFYSSDHDPLRRQNAAFASALRHVGVRHRYVVFSGSHDWRLWRAAAGTALRTASRSLLHARNG